MLIFYSGFSAALIVLGVIAYAVFVTLRAARRYFRG
jgi:hypothetical protein